MKTTSAESDVALLLEAEAVLKVAFAVWTHAATNQGQSAFSYVDIFTYGKHRLTREELELPPEREQLAVAALEHCATYVLMVQLDTLLERQLSGRFHHKNSAIASACWIARLIRNAFAHDPMHPTWQTHVDDTRSFVVPDVIALDMTARHGTRVGRMDYGGPLALLRLSEWVRKSALPSALEDASTPPLPREGTAEEITPRPE